ncbi:MAG: ribonuclease H-like domain-containing protein [Candidatus Limnocylindrales bacterium]
MSGATLERRLANYRAAIRSADSAATRPEPGDRVDGGVARGSIELGERLAAALDGELILDPGGPVVRVEPATVVLAIDRDRLRTLPGMPSAGAPLVCLDTETTGLATAAGTVAFLIGLGWWEGDRFRQVQLLLPDHPAEPGLLARLAAHIPADAWLVTYNGRGFDWPLLVARYRMARLPAPPHAGHLDLLPFVRRVFRHRMTDARLRTVETELLGTVRHGDVDGWQIPGLYLDFLRGGEAWPLIDVVRHNREDVRSLARLLNRIDVDYADPADRRRQPIGDLAGLARSFGRAGRLDEALGCLDAALEPPAPAIPALAPVGAAIADEPATLEPSDDPPGLPWWHPKRAADIGGRTARPSWERLLSGRLDSPWTIERITIERGRLLRRLGRHHEAVATWLDLAAGPGAVAVQAWIEVAKLREHRLGDIAGALDAANRAVALAERRRRLGMADPVVDRALAARLDRLRRRATARSVLRADAGDQDPTRSTAIATDPPPPRQSVASP